MQETLGTVLRRAREGKKMSLEKLAELSGVPVHFLTLFEEEHFLNEAPDAYAIAYLRKIG